jgi:inner membrane transporter RhtA
VIVGIASTQTGGAIAKTLFDDLGPAATAFLRVALAAVLLALIWRPRLAGHARRDLGLAAAFGVALCLMNLSFYEAIDRIPLGIAVTIEFAGPLGVAIALSRRAIDALWVLLAAAGILLLARGGGHIDTDGVLLALLAGVFWAAYILLNARAGRVFPGGSGLAIAMVVGGVVLLPVGIAGGGDKLLHPDLVAAAAGVAMLASAIPYSLELEALRRLPTQVFGILMSIEPAMAALAGFVILGEDLRARDIVAIVMVAAASAGSSLTAPAGRGAPPLDA